MQADADQWRLKMGQPIGQQGIFHGIGIGHQIATRPMRRASDGDEVDHAGDEPIQMADKAVAGAGFLHVEIINRRLLVIFVLVLVRVIVILIVIFIVLVLFSIDDDHAIKITSTITITSTSTNYRR